jgi:hypothetical protein
VRWAYHCADAEQDDPCRWQYNYGTRGRNETAIRVTKPGLHFMGAYHCVAHDGGLFAPDKFEMQPVASPTERELLSRILAEMGASQELRAYTRQIGLVKQRVAELSR